MSTKLTEAHIDLLKRIRSNRTRPSISSDDWDLFLDLANEGHVEDLGLGDARITPAGRRALSSASKPGER